MTLSYLRNIFFLFDLFVVLVHSEDLNVTGEAMTTRFWDCCKPSCSWNGKASFSHPVDTCNANDEPIADFTTGTGCGDGGSAYACSDQHPWAINDTLSYGYAGVFLVDHPDIEAFWCCSCYQLDFTSDPLKGKSMIVQASNTAYDVNTVNRFSLAIPGGNTTKDDGCTKQYGVEQSVFGQNHSGVASVDDCDNLPDSMQEPCRWRFDWFQDALYPTANFKRVVCPTELTDKTGCIRTDEKAFADGQTSGSSALFTTSHFLAGLAVGVASLVLV